VPGSERAGASPRRMAANASPASAAKV
jgi:hypothetical protein